MVILKEIVNGEGEKDREGGEGRNKNWEEDGCKD
jgi:hypothetical protein